jgi:N-acetylglucosamine kinase-like BadF-type ATPase
VSWALAVDGGNTKTLAVVAGDDGRTLGLGRAGCADIYNAPTPADALAEIARAAGAALEQAGIGADAIDSAAFSLAGADWPEDFTLLERELPERIGLRETPLVVNDSLGALRAGSPDWTGVAVVAGTYNAIGARHPDGRVFHLGFWPDGAGGRDIGRDGLRAVNRAAMGMGPATALTDLALEVYDATDPIALLYAFTRRGGLEEPDQDRFAPVVLDAADAGDAVAQALVAEKGRILGVQARATAAQLDLPLDGIRVVLTGGVFAHPTVRLADATLAELPGAVPVRDGLPPVAGALLLALDRVGVTIDAATVGAALLPHTAIEQRSARWAGSPSRA